MLKIRDRIIIKNGVSLYFSGKFGTVILINKNSKLPILVKIDDIDLPMSFTEDELQIINQSSNKERIDE
jgi:hypothetical protein